MFEIDYRGGNCVVISTRNLKLVADPKVSLFGLKDVNIHNVVEIATENRFLADSSDARLVIEGPGEYEIGDFSILGIPAVRHIDIESERSGTTMYRIVIGDISVALIGNIASKVSEEQLEAIGMVDVVILPVGGGGYTLDGTDAARLVRQIDPKVVIPVHYADVNLRYEVLQDSLDVFTNELGAPVESLDKFKLKSSASLPTVMTIVEIKRT